MSFYRHFASKDLLIAASMVWVTGYQRNFGAQGNDPQYASSWEGQYQIAFKSANVEELRKKWTSITRGPAERAATRDRWVRRTSGGAMSPSSTAAVI